MKLMADPHARNTQKSPSPATVFLSCFLCTHLIVITAYRFRHDRYQRLFILTSAILLAAEGSFFAIDLQDFVFRYMLLNIVAGLGLSLLFHRAMALLSWRVHAMDEACEN